MTVGARAVPCARIAKPITPLRRLRVAARNLRNDPGHASLTEPCDHQPLAHGSARGTPTRTHCRTKGHKRQGPGTRTITEPGGPTGLAVGPGLQPAGHKGGRRQQGWGGGRGDAQNKRASARTSTTEHNGPVDPPGLESATRRLQRAITTKWSEVAISGKWRVQRCPDRQWVM